MKVVSRISQRRMFSWVDLSDDRYVKEPRAFYGGLFGWDFEDQPADRHGRRLHYVPDRMAILLPVSARSPQK